MRDIPCYILVTYPVHTSTSFSHQDSLCKPTQPLASIQVSLHMGLGNKAAEFSYLKTLLVRESQIRDRGYIKCGRCKGHVTERSGRGLLRHTLIHIYIYIYIYICNICIHTYIYTCICRNDHIRIYIYRQNFVCISIYIHMYQIYLRTYFIHICMYTHTYTCTHKYIYIYIFI